MAAIKPLLLTYDLSRSFGGLTAVDQVRLSVPSGEIRAIIGPNGAGKTTLVSLICGRTEPSSGRIVFDGEEITSMPAHRRVRRGIAYTFQITSVFAKLSAYDNIALSVQRVLTASSGKRLTSRSLHAGVKEALDRVGLADRASTVAGNLAYGHQRLLELAMGLALQPRLLILDEPTQGLSDGEIANFTALVREIAREATVLLIEHNMPLVMALADKITVMNFGRVIAEGAPADIRTNRAVQNAYLGSAHG